MNRPDGPADKGDEPEKRAAEADDAHTADAGAGGEWAVGPVEEAVGQADGTDGAVGAGGAGDDAGTDYGTGGEVLEHGSVDGKEDGDGDERAARAEQSAVAQGAGAVVAAGLGIVSLTGSWLGTVAGARASLIGQLETSQGDSLATQLQRVYADQWQATALVGGIFALAALIVGVVVLARPAFGPPGEPQATWIKSVSWAGVTLGVLGLLLAVLKYSDAILGLPSASS